MVFDDEDGDAQSDECGTVARLLGRCEENSTGNATDSTATAGDEDCGLLDRIRGNCEPSAGESNEDCGLLDRIRGKCDEPILGTVIAPNGELEVSLKARAEHPTDEEVGEGNVVVYAIEDTPYQKAYNLEPAVLGEIGTATRFTGDPEGGDPQAQMLARVGHPAASIEQESGVSASHAQMLARSEGQTR